MIYKKLSFKDNELDELTNLYVHIDFNFNSVLLNLIFQMNLRLNLITYIKLAYTTIFPMKDE